MNWLFLVIGLGLLIGGAEVLVRGAARLAALAGLSSLIIGLTVVAFGTSAPELAVSVASAGDGRGDLALGNVLGSNIFNTLVILGLSALVIPLAVHTQLLRFDLWVMAAAAFVAWALAADGDIGRMEGVGLMVALLAYTVWCIRQGRASDHASRQRPASPPMPVRLTGFAWPSFQLLLGLGLLVLGARWLVQGAVGVAQSWGVSDLIVGLTIVAAGTSMPELATSLVAAARGQRDIAVGNVVGSNVFNLLGVLGAAAAAGPSGIAVSRAALHVDLPVMVATAAICLPIFASRRRVDRWEGVLLFAGYVGYVVWLILSAGAATVAAPGESPLAVRPTLTL